LQDFGNDSKEHLAAIEKMMEIDDRNLRKIGEYLTTHGYPNKADHGELACSAPWIVIHHSKNKFGARRKYFKYLYDAYQSNELDGGAFTFYLNRLYNFEKGERLDIIGAFTEKKEIDTLIQLLDLPKISN